MEPNLLCICKLCCSLDPDSLLWLRCSPFCYVFLCIHTKSLSVQCLPAGSFLFMLLHGVAFDPHGVGCFVNDALMWSPIESVMHESKLHLHLFPINTKLKQTFPFILYLQRVNTILLVSKGRLRKLPNIQTILMQHFVNPLLFHNVQCSKT